MKKILLPFLLLSFLQPISAQRRVAFEQIMPGLYLKEKAVKEDLSSKLQKLIVLKWFDDYESNARENQFYKISGKIGTDLNNTYHYTLECDSLDTKSRSVVRKSKIPKIFNGTFKDYEVFKKKQWPEIVREITLLMTTGEFREVVYYQKRFSPPLPPDMDAAFVKDLKDKLFDGLKSCKELNDEADFVYEDTQQGSNVLLVLQGGEVEHLNIQPRLHYRQKRRWNENHWMKDVNGYEDDMEEIVKILVQQICLQIK